MQKFGHFGAKKKFEPNRHLGRSCTEPFISCFVASCINFNCRLYLQKGTKFKKMDFKREVTITEL